MKVKAYLFETDDGSDDPRSIQGGGGASETLVRIARNSAWLIRAYIRAYQNRYGDTLIVRFGRESF
jgi:hypothetical protein